MYGQLLRSLLVGRQRSLKVNNLRYSHVEGAVRQIQLDVVHAYTRKLAHQPAGRSDQCDVLPLMPAQVLNKHRLELGYIRAGLGHTHDGDDRRMRSRHIPHTCRLINRVLQRGSMMSRLTVHLAAHTFLI